jgi:hypothetical protein
MWNITWAKQATGRQYRSHFGSEIKSQKKGAQLYQGLTKPEAAILVQMRSGKIRLAAYLKKIKAADTAVCQCQRSNETVSHTLGDCFQFVAPPEMASRNGSSEMVPPEMVSPESPPRPPKAVPPAGQRQRLMLHVHEALYNMILLSTVTVCRTLESTTPAPSSTGPSTSDKIYPKRR